MYLTPVGERTLVGAEAQLFAESLAMITDLLAEEDLPLGVSVVDELTFGQKLVVFLDVAQSLLCNGAPAIPLTACVEGAVSAVFSFAVDQLQRELDEPPLWHDEDESALPSWRELVLAASGEVGIECELPTVTETDSSVWSSLVESLADRVLWDHDWEHPDCYLDLAPDTVGRVKDLLGIADEYFVAVPREAGKAEIPRMIAALRGLTHRAV